MRQVDLSVVPGLAASFLAFAAVWGLRKLPFFDVVATAEPQMLMTLYGCVVAVALASLPFHFQAEHRAYRWVYRCVLAALLCYVATATLPLYDGMPRAIEHRLGPLQVARWIAIGTGVLAWRWPGLALPILVYIPWFRAEIDRIHGLDRAIWDYMSVLHLGLLLSVGFVIVVAGRWGARKFLPLSARDNRTSEPGLTGQTNSLDIVLRCCVAFHFASYFGSGLAKLSLDGGMFSWVLENQTHALMLVARELGTMPLASFGDLVLGAYVVFDHGYIAANVLTLVAELACIVAILHTRSTAILAAFYFLFHFGVYLSSGILFWKWMAAGAGIAVGLWSMRPAQPPILVMLSLVIIFLVAPHFIPTARLGWYDTHEINRAHFEAITDDGEVHRVPSNYFGSGSLTIIQNRYGLGLLGIRVATDVFGGTLGYRTMKAANSCRLRPQRTAGGKLGVKLERTWRRLRNYVWFHHAYVLSRVDERGRFSYDLYPHHVWSDPFSFREFARLDKRRIETYRFVSEVVCVKIQGGAIVTRVMDRKTRDIRIAH